jgi:P-type Cu2+ transporter
VTAPVAAALAIAARARRVMRANLWLAAGYNFVAVPLAILGFASPLVAALAMSGSSLLVTANALRARSSSQQAL